MARYGGYWRSPVVAEVAPATLLCRFLCSSSSSLAADVHAICRVLSDHRSPPPRPRLRPPTLRPQSYSVFIRAYCEAGDSHSALKMIENTKRKGLVPNVFTYNCVIRLLCEKEAKAEEAYELLDEMIERGVKPDVWTYNRILSVHCKLREVNKALRLLKRMDEDGCSPDQHTYNMLMKMLIGVGRIDRAMEVWDGMEERGFYPSVSIYAVMIHGLCRKKGRAKEACRYFDVMVDEGIPPYVSTCVLLRTELLRLGMQEKVDVLADRMRRSTSRTIQELSSVMEGQGEQVVPPLRFWKEEEEEK